MLHLWQNQVEVTHWLRREAMIGMVRALARQHNDTVVIASEAGPFGWVLPSSVVQFVCGQHVEPDEVTHQQQIFVIAMDPPYSRVAPRASGSEAWPVSAAFEKMKLPMPHLSITAEGLLRVRMVEGRSAERLGSFTIKAAAKAGGQRATLMHREIPRSTGSHDGGLDDVLLSPFVIAQQSFGGPAPGIAPWKKQPLVAASCLIPPNGGQVKKRAIKRQLEIWPDLKDRNVNLLLLGFNKSAPGGPHAIIERGAPFGRAPHRALSCVVHVLELARCDSNDFVKIYDELATEKLVRPRDEVIESRMRLARKQFWLMRGSPPARSVL